MNRVAAIAGKPGSHRFYVAPKFSGNPKSWGSWLARDWASTGNT
jgi:hypothetical protein